MKSRWIIGFLLICALAISANAQENSSVQSAEGPIANFARQHSGGATSPATQLQAPAGLQDVETYPDRLPLLAFAYDPGADAGANRSQAVAPRQSEPAQTEAEAGGGGMSRHFFAAALHALSTLRSMRTNSSSKRGSKVSRKTRCSRSWSASRRPSVPVWSPKITS